MNYTVYDQIHTITALQTDRVVQFLHTHLEQYGDSEGAIRKAIDYAAKRKSGFGGYIITLEEEHEIIGAVVINRTGMEDYIPENILVYIALHRAHRGKGLGGELMKHALEQCRGDVALHVEKDNPAIRLYEKLGFTTPYLEMRLKRS